MLVSSAAQTSAHAQHLIPHPHAYTCPHAFHPCQDITQGFADAAPSNSRVTFVLQHVPKASALPRRTGSCHFRYLRAEHPTSVKALLVSKERKGKAARLALWYGMPSGVGFKRRWWGHCGETEQQGLEGCTSEQRASMHF